MNADIRALVGEAAGKYGLDPVLLAAQVMQESSGDPLATRFEPAFHWFYGQALDDAERRWQATSWGLMQVMGATARGLGFPGPPFTDPADAVPVEWLDLGAHYLSKMKRLAFGDMMKALAYYNAGPGRAEAGAAYAAAVMQRIANGEVR